MLALVPTPTAEAVPAPRVHVAVLVDGHKVVLRFPDIKAYNHFVSYATARPDLWLDVEDASGRPLKVHTGHIGMIGGIL